METPEYTHEEILNSMRKASQGDSGAFDMVYRQFYAPIYRYIYFRVRHKQDSEDLVQSVFLRAYSAIARFETGGKSPLAYFYTVARNMVIDYWRRKKELLMRDAESMPLAGGIVGDVSIEEITETDERKKEVLAGVLHLTPDQQEVIINKFINSMPTREIARMMGKTEMAVRALQSRALQTLRGFIKE